MSSSSLLYALSLIPGIGNKTLRDLITTFGTVEAIWNASESKLLHTKGIGPKTIDHLIHWRNTLRPDEEWQKIIDQEIDIITFLDDEYPSILKEIPDSPMILFTRGSYNFRIEKPMIAIVGSRKCTNYGKQVAHKLASDLSLAGYTIVSGLAFGIDSIAHKAVLDTEGSTIAVLAGGVDDPSIAPQTHLSLAKNILKKGMILSEYLPGLQATEHTFPARNRIVAGMCVGTIVVEAEEKSGALITAGLALDYNRDVFAVPGSLFSPLSRGTNHLIKSGAKIVTSLQDILEEFPLPEKNNIVNTSLLSQKESVYTDVEKKILSVLSNEPLHIDKIIKAVRLEIPLISSTLTLLEIKGCIRNIGGMCYIKI